jgi:hypothetical protein
MISMGVSAASGIMQYMGAQDANEQQAKAMTANYNANDAAAQTQQNQINEQATQQKSARAVDAMRERGRLLALDMGGGNSTQHMLQSSVFAESTDMATLEANRAANIQQSQQQKTSNARQTGNAIAAMPQPSLLGVGLQIAGAGLDTYSRNRPPVNKADY